MKFDWKRALGTVIMSAALVLFLGIPLLWLYIIASFGAVPLYVVKVLPAAEIGFLAAMILSMSGYLSRKWVKRVWMSFLCICLVCGVYIGVGAYQDSIPTVDERALMLREYEPFAEGTKAAVLDEPSTLQFDVTTARSLRLDGATALYPVYAAFAQAVFPKGEYPMYGTGSAKYASVACTNTVNAYERLIYGETDIIFVAGPSDEQLEMAKRAGRQLHLTPVGREAFVFFVNSRNPVTSLTVEQIQKIYSGQITNWKEVGGKNQSIRPFQRAENSGSQTALQRLMGDAPLMEPEEDERIGGMGGIIRQVASYRNYKNALGFSFRFYATQMDASDQIRLLALNGVEPTKETIRDGSYPVASEFYAVTASAIGKPAPQETDGTVKAFLDWVLSPQGQQLVEKTGYVALN